MRRIETAVVGAGAAGLAAAAALRRSGITPVVLERADRVGASWAERYERLRLHTTRRFSGLPYRPLAASLPRYVTKDEYAAYLADYARDEELDVRVGHDVRRIEAGDGAWRVETADDVFSAPVVVVATGKHRRRRLPESLRADAFAGTLVHSADYTTGRELAGARVLVVGIGNSGAEIATDLVEHEAAAVALAVRSAPPIVRREVFGIPTQVLGIVFKPFPPRAVDRVGALMRRVAVGDLSAYGLAEADWGPFEARRPPVIEVGFLETLRQGRISIRPPVAHLTERGAVFADGTEEAFDAVIAATGFDAALEEFLEVDGVLDERGLPQVAEDGSSAVPGLYFIGFRESPRGALYEASHDAPKLARSVARYVAGRTPVTATRA